eukprot:3178753-Pyramimonas_sp.AAC.1
MQIGFARTGDLPQPQARNLSQKQLRRRGGRGGGGGLWKWGRTAPPPGGRQSGFWTRPTALRTTFGLAL